MNSLYRTVPNMSYQNNYTNVSFKYHYIVFALNTINCNKNK